MPVLSEAPRTPHSVSLGTESITPPNLPDIESPNLHDSRKKQLDVFNLFQAYRPAIGDPAIFYSYSDLEALKPGFTIPDIIPTPRTILEGGTIFDLETTTSSVEEFPSQIYKYTDFTTKNGFNWELLFNMQEAQKFPIAKNFDRDKQPSIRISDENFALLDTRLRGIEMTQRERLSDHEIQHTLFDFFIDQNQTQILSLLTGKSSEEQTKLGVYKEPVLQVETSSGMQDFGVPDCVLVDPDQGIFIYEYNQVRNKKSDRSKYKQLKKHVHGVTNIANEIFSNSDFPRITPVLFKFRLRKGRAIVTLRPFIMNKQSIVAETLPTAA